MARGLAPAWMIALELEAQADAIAAQPLVFVAGQDSCIAFHQLVVIAEQPEGDPARAIACDAFHDACPALGRVIEELGHIHFESDAAAGHLDMSLYLVGVVPAADARG